MREVVALFLPGPSMLFATLAMLQNDVPFTVVLLIFTLISIAYAFALCFARSKPLLVGGSFLFTTICVVAIGEGFGVLFIILNFVTIFVTAIWLLLKGEGKQPARQ